MCDTLPGTDLRACAEFQSYPFSSCGGDASRTVVRTDGQTDGQTANLNISHCHDGYNYQYDIRIPSLHDRLACTKYKNGYCLHHAVFRVTTCLENLEMSANLTAVREM